MINRKSSASISNLGGAMTEKEVNERKIMKLLRKGINIGKLSHKRDELHKR